jgi:hypothetical protein
LPNGLGADKTGLYEAELEPIGLMYDKFKEGNIASGTM